jgi:glutamate dehydrogenase (NAD(P)+)
MHRGHTVQAVVTGKPQEIGGTRGRREATSRGAFRTILAAARARGLALDGAPVVVQGFGRVGTVLAEMLDGAGCRIVALADDRHAVTNANGIDVAKAVAWMNEHDTVRGLPQAEPMDRNALFGLDCAVLVTAGIQNEIEGHEAEAIRAEIVAEVANAAITPDGDAVLRDRGITVIPDILCNAGSLVLGYFEWVQDMQSFFWTDAEVMGELDRIMDESFASVLAMSEQRKVDLRGAAMMVAVGRVAEATSLRGLYP